MNDLMHRLALAVLVVSGLLTAALPWAPPEAAGVPLVLHRQFMVGLLGLGLALAAALPSLRLPAIAAAVLSKAAFIALALVSPETQVGGLAAIALETVLAGLLCAAAAVFLREAREDARWHGMLPLRRGAWN